MKLVWLVVVIQIVVESLPISSSTHLRLFDEFFFSGRLADMVPPCFDEFLHGPTIVILILFFRKEWFVPLRFLWSSLIANFSQTAQLRDSQRRLLNIFFKISGLVFVCVLSPVIMRYGIIKPFLKHTAWYSSDWMLLAGLVVTSGALLSLRCCSSKPSMPFDTLASGEHPSSSSGGTSGCSGDRMIVQNFLFKTIVLACVHALSLLPGISRFASTYVAARWLGWQPRRAFQICFLIELPLIGAAFGINGVRGLLKTPGAMQIFSWEVIAALLGATVIGYLFLWIAQRMAHGKTLWWFGVYMWVPIVLVILKRFVL